VPPRYCNKMAIADWLTHLNDKLVELHPIRKFSIVYQHYSQRGGNCIYVGRTDSPLPRPQEYLRNRHNVCPRTGRAHNFVNYKVFTNPSRKHNAYDEECTKFHNMPANYQRDQNHPHKPHGTNRRCPVQNCPH